MGPLKALGVDGFLAMFFQNYWHIVGKEVSSFCLAIMNDNQTLEEINQTNIILISKTQNTTNLINFRPISLYNIINKRSFKRR